MSEIFKNALNPYCGETSFWGIGYSKDLSGVDVAVIGAPFDMTVSNRPGCRFGPRGIRTSSVYVGYYPQYFYPWDFNPKEKYKLVDWGDSAIKIPNVDEFRRGLEADVSKIMDAGASVLGLGGDHSTTDPLVRAVSKKHGKLSVIHFDSHTDAWETPHPSHGGMFWDLKRDEMIDPSSTIQLGIRTPWDESMGYNVKDARWVNSHSPEEIVNEIKNTVGNNKIYLTFDIDWLDAAVAPGTGTPVCGGPNMAHTREILFGLAGLPIVGADIVEVSPPFDVAEMTQIAGATIALDLLHLLCKAR